MRVKDLISRGTAHLQYIWLGRPARLIYFGWGFGDDLLCTTVAREMKKRGVGKIVMFTRHPTLLDQNSDYSGVYNMSRLSSWAVLAPRKHRHDDFFAFKKHGATFGRLRLWGYNCIVPWYSSFEEGIDRDTMRNEHILATMCRSADVTGTVGLRPYMPLTASEKKAGAGPQRNNRWPA